MDQFFHIVLRSLGTPSVAVVMVGAALFAVIMALVRPIYFFLKNKGPGPVSVTFRLGSAQSSGDAQSLSSEQQEQLLRGLETVERGFSMVPAVLFSMIMAVASGAMVYLYLKTPDDDHRFSQILLFGFGYALVMLWSLGQLVSVLRRLNPTPTTISGPRTDISVTFHDGGLERIRQHIDQGGTMEEACALVNPEFPSLTPILQQAFKKAVEAAIERSRKVHGS